MTGNGSKEIVVNFFCNPPFVGEMGRDKRRTVNRKTYESGLLESKIARSIFWTMNGTHFWMIENFKSGSICEKKLFIKLSLWEKERKDCESAYENSKSIRGTRTTYLIIYPLHARIRLSLIKRKCVTSA